MLFENGSAIGYLADHFIALPRLKAWCEQEWGPYYGPGGPGDAEGDLAACCQRNTLPIALVAMHGGEVYRTAALKVESVASHRHLSPWVAALLVGTWHRRQGVGMALIIQKVGLRPVMQIAINEGWSVLRLRRKPLVGK